MIWRTFLQDASTVVDSYVVVETPGVTADQSIMLKIADCDQSIKLWFGWGTDRRYKISRKKLARLQEALDRVKDGLDDLEARTK